MTTKTNSKDNTKLIVAATAATVAAVAFIVQRSRKQAKKKNRGIQRSWSFTSEGMRLGVFPPEIKAPPTIINAAMYFENDAGGGCPGVADLATHVVTPLLQYDRFSKIPTANGLRDSLMSYKATDLIRTVEILKQQQEGDKTKKDDDETLLHETIYSLLSDPLDSGRDDKPYWELVRIVPPAATAAAAAKRSVVLLRVHHCLGDGLSLVNVFDKIITTQNGQPIQSKVTKALMNRQYNKPSIGSILSSIIDVVTLGSSKFDDNTTIFNKDLTYSGNRKFVLFPDVPLEYIKQCKNKAPFPTTINDILMCAISQAVHDYCVQQKNDALVEKGKDLQCRALLPVSLPRGKSSEEDGATALQNRFCMVSSDLCVGETDLLNRLQAIHDTTTQLKQSPIAVVQLWMQNNIVSKLPTHVGRQTAHDIFARHTLVLTNVPGPQEPCWLVPGRHEVKGLQLFFPNVIPQVDLVSYGGIVYGNIIYDPKDWGEDENDNTATSMATLYAKALVDLGNQFGVKDIPTALQQAVDNALR